MSDTTSRRAPPPHAGAWAVGLSTVGTDGRALDSWYPHPRLGLDGDGRQLAEALGAAVPGSVRVDASTAAHHLGVDPAPALGADPRRGVERVAVASFVEHLADPPVDAYDVYLRLHLLSHRLIQPHGANLDEIFGLLSTVVWTSAGPCPPESFEDVRLAYQAAGTPLQVYGLDKFPRMTDYVVPSGVRIADADRVRLGAHLASGTTVMHPGFVNFNAGTLGAAMVEGRITAGTVVEEGADIGAGASLMGTLSGGGKEVIRVGKRSLVGANGGIGIALGDDCVVEAGLYVTAGTRVTLPDGRVTKALELSGQDGLLFRRNSTTGAIEALHRSGGGITLNADLHRN